MPRRRGLTIPPAVRPFVFAVLVICALGFGAKAFAQVDAFAAPPTAATRLSPQLGSSSLAGDAQGLLGLKEPAGGRKPLSLGDALKRVTGDAPDGRIALERSLQQEVQLRRAWALVLPTLSAGAAYTHNCTGGENGIDCADRTQNLVNKDQLEQQAQLFESIADIVSAVADVGDPAEEEQLRQQAADLDKTAADLRATDTRAVVVQPASQLTGQITFNLPLLNPRAWPAIMNAYDGVDAAHEVLRQTQQALAFSVVRAYYAAFTAQRLVAASERQLAAVTAQRDVVRVRVEASTQPVLSLKRSELEVLRAEQSLSQSRAAADNAIGVLGAALGVDEMFTLVEPPAVPAGADIVAGVYDPNIADGGNINGSINAKADELVDRALEQRVEVKSQKLALQIAERGTVDAWMQFLPQLGLQASARATSFTQGFVRDPVTGTLLISATVPLYDGGLRYAAMHESSSRSSEESVRLRQVQDRVRAQVRGNLRDVAVRVTALRLSQQALEVSREAQAQAQALFDAGVGTALDLSETNFAVFVAETDAVRAELDLATARLGLQWALGDPLY